MSICAAACTLNPPVMANPCVRQTRSGGIPNLIVFACDFVFVDQSLLTEWCAGITTGKIALSPPLVGGKPVTTFTNKRVDSCTPEAPVGGLKTIDFTSISTDNTATGARNLQFTDVDFWNNLLVNQARYQYGYMDCDGRVYAIIPEAALEVSLMHEDNSTGNQTWTGKLSWQALLEIKPYYVPGLKAALNGGCP